MLLCWLRAPCRTAWPAYHACHMAEQSRHYPQILG